MNSHQCETRINVDRKNVAGGQNKMKGDGKIRSKKTRLPFFAEKTGGRGRCFVSALSPSLSLPRSLSVSIRSSVSTVDDAVSPLSRRGVLTFAFVKRAPSLWSGLLPPCVRPRSPAFSQRPRKEDPSDCRVVWGLPRSTPHSQFH